MADQAAPEDGAPGIDVEASNSSKMRAERRKIPGNLPYTSSPGALKRVIDKLPTIEKPHVFNSDFLSTVLQVSGGSARPIPPIFKAMGLLSAGGNPTDLYSQFQTELGRPRASLQALKNAYAEIFRRNQYAHKADERTLTDLVVSITGLPKSEGIVRYIINTFQVLQEYAKSASEDVPQAVEVSEEIEQVPIKQPTAQLTAPSNSGLGLVYNINIVLPETTNVEVYNSIFKSLKGNLLS